MQKAYFVIVTLLFLLCTEIVGQSADLPHNSLSRHLFDRLQLLTGIESKIRPEFGNFPRKDVADWAHHADSLSVGWSRRDKQDLLFLILDNEDNLPPQYLSSSAVKKPFKLFYKDKAHLYAVNKRDFSLRVNPMVQFALGPESGDREWLFINQRGIELRGIVDQRIYFYTNVLETQARYPTYVRDWRTDYQSLPTAGFVKPYNPRDYNPILPNVTDGVDFNVATAYMGYRMTKNVSIQVGHGRQFIGNGYRSLWLSEVGAPLFSVKLNTRIWRFQYQNLFTEITSRKPSSGGDKLLPKRYAAIHYLNYRATPRLSFGLYEAVMFSRADHFEFQYLNPLILYRTVEGMIGSPDNVLIGLDGRWDLFKRLRVYGQMILDEFDYDELVNPKLSGYWANKYGLQAGFKYFNVAEIDHLDLQVEWNRVRPFTYSHFDSLSSYTHYNQPLAHPLWANFNEWFSMLTYRPTFRLTATARWMHALKGENETGKNWGANPLITYKSRVSDYGNVVGQGLQYRINLIGIDLSYMFFHNMFVDIGMLIRRSKQVNSVNHEQITVYKLGIRMNVWNQNLDF